MVLCLARLWDLLRLRNGELNIDRYRDVLNHLNLNTQFRPAQGPDQTPSIEIGPAQGLAQYPRQRILNLDWLRNLIKRVNGFFLSNQPDAPVVQIYSVIKILMFRTSSPSRVRMELSSILTLLGSGHQNLHETYQCRIHSRKLLMMSREDARNIWRFITE